MTNDDLHLQLKHSLGIRVSNWTSNPDFGFFFLLIKSKGRIFGESCTEKAQVLLTTPDTLSCEISLQRSGSLYNPDTLSCEIFLQRSGSLNNPDTLSCEIFLQRSGSLNNHRYFVPAKVRFFKQAQILCSCEISCKGQVLSTTPDTLSCEIFLQRSGSLNNPRSFKNPTYLVLYNIPAPH